MTQLRWIGALVLLALGIGLAAYVLWPMIAKEKVKTKQAEAATTVATTQTTVVAKAAQTSEKARVKIQTIGARTAVAAGHAADPGADLDRTFTDGVCDSPVYSALSACQSAGHSSGALSGGGAGSPVNGR